MLHVGTLVDAIQIEEDASLLHHENAGSQHEQFIKLIDVELFKRFEGPVHGNSLLIEKGSIASRAGAGINLC